MTRTRYRRPPHLAPLSRLAAAGAVLASLSLLSACEEAGGEGQEVERFERGDTTVVRTVSGSAWERPARLEEELRIGALDGAVEEMFGPNLVMAPDRQGGVYVFDGAVPALRHFDADGRYTRTLGREGSGPGEYRDAALGLAVLEDGRVLMRDPRNTRINVYGPDGRPADHWPVESGLFTSNAMVVDTAGDLYLKALIGEIEHERPWPIGLLHLDATGALVDTIAPPTIPGEPERGGSTTYTPGKVWEMSPWGEMVAGMNSSYTFQMHRRDGTILRIERAHEPIPVGREERAELEARNDWTRRHRGQFMTAEIPPVPSEKPAYRGFAFDEEGRIWVRVHVPSERFDPDPPSRMPGVEEPPPSVSWREPVAFDVFDRDGDYLGRVDVPERTTIHSIRGDEVWATQRGEFDELYVIRYRLVRDG